MKNITFFCFLILALSVEAGNKDVMRINLANGTVKTFDVTEVDSITFATVESASYITADNVFTGKKVIRYEAAIGGYDEAVYDISYNDKGQLIQFHFKNNENDQTVPVEYPANNRMKFSYSGAEIELTAGDNMFARGLTLKEGNDFEALSFEYDAEGHLVGYVNDWKIYWDNDGNISKVIEDDVVITYIYDYSKFSHGLFLGDAMFRIDFDNAQDLNFAGVYGLAPTNLPVVVEERNLRYPEENFTRTLQWEVDGDGYPVMMVERNDYNSYDESTIYRFTWQ